MTVGIIYYSTYLYNGDNTVS